MPVDTEQALSACLVKFWTLLREGSTASQGFDELSSNMTLELLTMGSLLNSRDFVLDLRIVTDDGEKLWPIRILIDATSHIRCWVPQLRDPSNYSDRSVANLVNWYRSKLPLTTLQLPMDRVVPYLEADKPIYVFPKR